MDEEQDTYGNYPDRDMDQDYDYYMCMGELSELFEDEPEDDGSPIIYSPQPRSKSAKEMIAECRRRIEDNKRILKELEVKMEALRQKLESRDLSHLRRNSPGELLNNILPAQIAKIKAEIQKDEDKIVEIETGRIKDVNFVTIALCVAAVIAAFFILHAAFC